MSGRILLMQTTPLTFFLMKLSDGEIAAHRTIQVIEKFGLFTVSVTERDYLEDDPTGQRLTLFPQSDYDSLDAANAEAENQNRLSLAEGFITNKMPKI